MTDEGWGSHTEEELEEAKEEMAKDNVVNLYPERVMTIEELVRDKLVNMPESLKVDKPHLDETAWMISSTVGLLVDYMTRMGYDPIRFLEGVLMDLKGDYDDIND
jgi:hypothetical protein